MKKKSKINYWMWGFFILTFITFAWVYWFTPLLINQGVAWEDSYSAGYFAGIVKGRITSVGSTYCQHGVYSEELCACAKKYELPENFKKFCMPIYTKNMQVIE